MMTDTPSVQSVDRPPYPWLSLIGSVLAFLIGLGMRGNNNGPADGTLLMWLAVWFFTFRHFDWRLRR